jgi:hypothetical protein
LEQVVAGLGNERRHLIDLLGELARNEAARAPRR